jgi:hypothetical protein
MKLSRLAFLLTASTLPFSGCECREVITRLAPIVGVGDPFDGTFSVCTEGLNSDETNKFLNCNFDFGDVDVGRARVFSFTVRNPSPVKLSVGGIEFEDGSDPAFSVDGDVPTEVASGVGTIGAVVSVKFQPSIEGAVSGTLVIRTDGENLDVAGNGDGKVDDAEHVRIHFTANGISRCKPKIAVTPTDVNFGDVGVGATAFQDVTIKNEGACELIVTDLGFTDATAFPEVFGPSGNVIIPITIQGGTSASLRLYARPRSTQLETGGLIITSLDPENPEVTVPLSVQGADVPTCVARVSRVNSTTIAPNDASPAIEPLDDVEFSSDQSSSARAGGTIAQRAWRIISKPNESSATLTDAAGATTRLRFSSAAGNVNGVDVAGDFTLGLVVTDDLGAVSTECTVAISAVPRSGLHVQLTWDRPDNDIDLHLTRATPHTSGWCGVDDCYFGGTSRNWGGGDRNPSLDIDDLEGFGPENINIESPGDGNYTVGVGMYTHDSDSTVTVKIFVGGALEFEGFQLMGNDDQWVPARVEVRSGVSTVVDLSDTSSQTGSCWGGF